MIALKLKLKLLYNFYSILDDSTPPTCRVDKQDNDHDEQVNNINNFKEGVRNGSIPSAVTDSRATSSIRTQQDRDRNAFIATEQESDKAACPTARWMRQATWTNFIMTCTTLQRTYTLCQESNDTLSSASPSLLTQTKLQSLTRTKSTSTIQTKQPSSSPAARSSKYGNADRQIYGKSPSSEMSRTTTPTQFSTINALQNSYPTDHHQARPSTMCTSSKCNPNLCDTTRQWPDSPLNHRG